MQKQRERMEARRKRLKEAAKKAAESKNTKTTPAKVKGIGPVNDGATYARKLKNSKTEPTGVGPVKSGAAYARSLTKGKSATTKNQPANKIPQRFADGAKGGKYDKAVQNKEKAKSNFFRSSSGTRGESLPSKPKLKSQPKKPARKDFPSGRQGASAYAAALRKYNAAIARVGKPKVTRNRRGRAV